MLGKVEQQVAIPIGLTVTKVEQTHAMATGMYKDCGRAVENFPAVVVEPSAKVHIFEPDRKEAFIESVDILPGRTSHS
jgi:hypothetical protein